MVLDLHCVACHNVEYGSRTLSGLIDFMATSKLRLTFIILPVICRIVTAVWTRPATASTREASCRRLSFSFCLRTAFWA